MKEKIMEVFSRNLTWDLKDLNYVNTIKELETLFEEQRREELIKFVEFLQRTYKEYSDPNGSMDCDEAYMFFVPNSGDHDNLPVIIRSKNGKLQFPYISWHAFEQSEKGLGKELYKLINEVKK